DLRAEGVHEKGVELYRYVDAKYPSQVHEITIPVPGDTLSEADIPRLAENFHRMHEQLYTYCVRDTSVAFFHWRLTAVGKTPKVRVRKQRRVGASPRAALKTRRPVYFEEKGDYVNTPIYLGEKLQHGMEVRGPAVIERENTTVVVFPGQRLRVNRYGDYHLRCSPRRRARAKA
ncbi:MAG: hypothetical protein ACE5LX_07130, partial [Nitrospinota bacterium]